MEFGKPYQITADQYNKLIGRSKDIQGESYIALYKTEELMTDTMTVETIKYWVVLYPNYEEDGDIVGDCYINVI